MYERMDANCERFDNVKQFGSHFAHIPVCGK